MRELLCKPRLYLKRSSPTILACAGAIGVVMTTVMAVKATPKALQILEHERWKRHEDGADKYTDPLKLTEIIRLSFPCYIPATVMGLSTIACIFGSNMLNKKQRAAITSAYILLDAAYKEHKDKVRELLGEEASNQVRDAIVKDRYAEDDFCISDEKYLFYEEHVGQFFERTKEEVLLAEYHFNRNFALRGYASLNEFYEFLGLPAIDAGEMLGWSLDAGGAFYGYSWVDFVHRKFTMDDGLECCAIEMPFAPTPDYLGEW